MHADFRIQGYETPDGSFASSSAARRPQLLAPLRAAQPARGPRSCSTWRPSTRRCSTSRACRRASACSSRARRGGHRASMPSPARAARRAGHRARLHEPKRARSCSRRGGHAFVNRKDPRWTARSRRCRSRPTARGRGPPPARSSRPWCGRRTAARPSTWWSPPSGAISSGAWWTCSARADGWCSTARPAGTRWRSSASAGAAPAQEMFRRAGLRPTHGVLVYAARRDRRRSGRRRRDPGGAAGRRAGGGGAPQGRAGGAIQESSASTARSAWRRWPAARVPLARDDARQRGGSGRLPRVPGLHAQAVRAGHRAGSSRPPTIRAAIRT